MKVLITGTKGFIGKNLKFFLLNKNFEILEYNRNDNIKKLDKYLKICDVVFHLAGENRSKIKKNFNKNNYKFTKILIDKICLLKKKPSIVFSSTIKVNEKNDYGTSKKKSEEYIKKKLQSININYSILRLPNVFGKWSKPNHNSFIATCCYNLIRNKKIELDSNKKLKLIYIDDLVEILFKESNKCLVTNKNYKKIIKEVKSYKITLYNLYKILENFKYKYKSINNNLVNSKLKKKLFSTFISFLPMNYSKFKIEKKNDYRGDFVEFSKSEGSGQISYFTIKPGVVRGKHYHNTKIEKFLLINGSVDYVTKDLNNNKKKLIKLNSSNAEIIYSIPGHVHYFKNKTKKEATVLVWANEVFSEFKPDTNILKYDKI